MFGNCRIDKLVLSVVAKELIENVIRERCLILQEYFQCLLHTVKRCRFPNEFDRKFSLRFNWTTLLILNLQTYFLGLRYLHNMAFTFPFNFSIFFIHKFQFITWYKSNIVFIWKEKEGLFLPVDIIIPSNLDITLRLLLFICLVIVCFEFY